LVAAFGLAGCVTEQNPATPSTSNTPAAVGAAPDQAGLPTPEALAGVIYTLADTSVPAEQKVGVVQYATVDDEPALARFGQALKDSGFVPVTVTAEDLKWSTSPGNVTATVTIASPNPAVQPFTYPLEFSPLHDTWQLTKRSADELLPLNGA
jgi:hypothetical protein